MFFALGGIVAITGALIALAMVGTAGVAGFTTIVVMTMAAGFVVWSRNRPVHESIRAVWEELKCFLFLRYEVVIYRASDGRLAHCVERRDRRHVLEARYAIHVVVSNLFPYTRATGYIGVRTGDVVVRDKTVRIRMTDCTLTRMSVQGPGSYYTTDILEYLGTCEEYGCCDPTAVLRNATKKLPRLRWDLHIKDERLISEEKAHNRTSDRVVALSVILDEALTVLAETREVVQPKSKFRQHLPREAEALDSYLGKKHAILVRRRLLSNLSPEATHPALFDEEFEEVPLSAVAD